MTRLSEIASEIDQLNDDAGHALDQKDDEKHKEAFAGIIKKWEEAVELAHKLLGTLTDKSQKSVVEYLITPWMEGFLVVLKEPKNDTKENVDLYYFFKNYVMIGLQKLPAGIAP